MSQIFVLKSGCCITNNPPSLNALVCQESVNKQWLLAISSHRENGDKQCHNLNSRLATATPEPVLTQIQAHRRQSWALLDTMSLLTADDSQPKIHSKSSRSFSVTVSSREMPSYRNKKQKEIIPSNLQTTMGGAGGYNDMGWDDKTGKCPSQTPHAL